MRTVPLTLSAHACEEWCKDALQVVLRVARRASDGCRSAVILASRSIAKEVSAAENWTRQSVIE